MKKARFLSGSDMTDAELLAAVHERLTYDAETGAFYRKAGFVGVKAGARLGSPDSFGKLQATFYGTRYMVAHLVCLVETGALPISCVVHINGDNADSKFENLSVGRVVKFLERARAKFGAAHDYSAVEYMNADQKVTIKCRVHGPFRRTPEAYLTSAKGCPTCCSEHAREESRVSPEQKAATARRRAKAHADYQKRNPDIYNKAGREHYHRNKHRPDFKAGRLCRVMVSRVLRKTKQGRTGHTEVLLGYTVQEFKEHIEQQFKPWMTWDNHGQWHVDHIRPVSWYVTNGLTDPAVINALSNLRPLEASANQRKSDKLLECVSR